MDPSSPPFAYVAPSGHVGIVVHEAVAWHKARPAPEGEVRFSKASMITSFTFHLEGMPQYKGKRIMREKLLTMGLINYLFTRVSRCCWHVPASQKIVGRFSLEEIVSFSIIWVDTPIC